jgi:signal transduction histidine kinase
VRDDGVGFDASLKPRSAYGLVGMRYRVEAEGGTMHLQSKPGEGTLIEVSLPQSTPEVRTSPATANSAPPVGGVLRGLARSPDRALAV